MAKIKTDDLINLGFNAEMFVFSDAMTFDQFLSNVIDEQAALLSARIGASVYSSTNTDTAARVARAEKCLAAAELYQRRFNAIAQDIRKADGMDAFKLRRTWKAYRDEAESLIERLAANDSFASNVTVSSHFEEDTSA